MTFFTAAMRLLGRVDGRTRGHGVSGEIGWGGAKVFSGIVLDEYNPDLKGRLAVQTAEKMRRTSGQVRAVEMVLRLPIESTKWSIEEPRQAGSGERVKRLRL